MHGLRPGRMLSAVVMLAALCAEYPAHAQQPADAGGFWFVSSRGCPQGSLNSEPGCPLTYMHVGADGCLRCSTEDVFRTSLIPGVPVCFVIHGSLVRWKDMLIEAPRVYRWLRGAAPHRPLQVVFFTWPSDRCLSPLPQIDVLVLGRMAEYNGFYLAKAVSQVPPSCPVSIFGHSHGARIASSALHLFGGGEILGRTLIGACGAGHRVRAVYAAAAIDHNWLNPGDRYDAALGQMEALLNVRNDDDLALCFYPLQRCFAAPALGEEGFTRRDIEAVGWQAPKLSTLDVTELLGTGHTWVHYYTQPQIAAAIVPWVYFDPPQQAADVMALPPAPAESVPGTAVVVPPTN